MGAMVAMASSASFQREPVMLLLSSTMKTVSNSARKAYGEWSVVVEGRADGGDVVVSV